MHRSYLLFSSFGLAKVPDSLSTLIWMVYPVPRWLTPYRASPSCMSEIHWPFELFKVTVRPLAATTPESLFTAPAASALPRRVDVNVYVPSSLISSSWPDVPTRFVLCTEDSMFPPDFLRRVVADRLGIVPDEIAAGHCVALSRPNELAALLERYLGTTTPTRSDLR